MKRPALAACVLLAACASPSGKAVVAGGAHCAYDIPPWQPGCAPVPLIDPEGYLIDHATEAQCAVEECSRAGATELPRCAFVDAGHDACSADSASPGAVSNAPCWFVCDSAGLGRDACAAITSSDHARSLADLGYDPRWQLRTCYASDCDPRRTQPSGAVVNVTCLACSLDADSCAVR